MTDLNVDETWDSIDYEPQVVQNSSGIAEANDFRSLISNINFCEYWPIIPVTELVNTTYYEEKGDKIYFRAKYKDKFVFVKAYLYNQQDYQILLAIKNELKAALKFQKNANFVQLLGIVYLKLENKSAIGLVQECGLYLSLDKHLYLNPNVLFIRKIKWALQICLALQDFHEQQLLHHDIHPSNFVLFDNDIVKICDFDWMITSKMSVISTPNHDHPAFHAGSNAYLAPECYINCIYTIASEIYALGMTLAFIFSEFRKELCENFSNNTILKQFIAKKINEKRNDNIIPMNYHMILQTLIFECLDETPDKRPKLKEITRIIQRIDQECNLQHNEKDSFHYLKFENEIKLFNKIYENNHLELFNTFTLQIHKDGYTFFSYLTEKNYDEVFELSLKCPSYQPNDFKIDLLLKEICRCNNLLLLTKLIDKGYFIFDDFLIPDQNENNFFRNVCCENKYELLKFLFHKYKPLIEKEYFLETKQDERNALIYACRYGYLEIIQVFVDNHFYKKSDFEAKNSHHRNAFMAACEHNHLHVVRFLIENEQIKYDNYQINNQNLRNAFMLACRNGHLEIVKYLIENKYCPFTLFYEEDTKGYNAYIIAKEHRHTKIVKYLDMLEKYEGICNYWGVPNLGNVAFQGLSNIFK